LLTFGRKITDISCPTKANNLIFVSCEKKILAQGKKYTPPPIKIKWPFPK